jgi:hypothetical protein
MTSLITKLFIKDYENVKSEIAAAYARWEEISLQLEA